MEDYISIYEAAKKLQVSHTTIYNKLKDKEVYKELEPFIKKIKNTKYLKIKGLEILKKHFKETQINQPETLNTNINALTNLQESFISSLQDRIKHLENEVDIKNKHIETQAKLIENSQILLRDSQSLLKQLKQPKKNFLIGFLKKNKKEDSSG
ncbi:MAG: hypothetical protein ABF289_06535, partial [Clostridiales bacterium]